MIFRSVALLALCTTLALFAHGQASYPEVKFTPIPGKKTWRITPNYPNPNPPPLRIRLDDSTILEYTVFDGFETNFRSGPEIADIIAAQTGSNNLNLAWLLHDINYDGYLGGRKIAHKLLYSMLRRFAS